MESSVLGKSSYELTDVNVGRRPETTRPETTHVLIPGAADQLLACSSMCRYDKALRRGRASCYDEEKAKDVAGRFESTEVYSRMYLRNPRLDTSMTSTYTCIILNDLSNVLSNENREDLLYEK